MRHKWSISKVARDTEAYCVNCGLIRAVSYNSKVFYYSTNVATDKAGRCPGKPTYNQPSPLMRKQIK